MRAPILDANVKRILARLFGIEGLIAKKKTSDRLWSLAQDLLPVDPVNMPVYTQALMDFGATWCTSRKPVCLSGAHKCPFSKECQANLSNQVLMLPQKAAKVKSPEFNADMLLMRCRDFVLLQKRPDKAIWGGLWSLPESVWRAKASDLLPLPNLSLKELLQLTLSEESAEPFLKHRKVVSRGEQIKHVFTHRRLWMQIWQVNMPALITFSSPSLKWIALRHLGQYGLPQPIKLLLQGLSLARDDELKN